MNLGLGEFVGCDQLQFLIDPSDEEEKNNSGFLTFEKNVKLFWTKKRIESKILNLKNN